MFNTLIAAIGLLKTAKHLDEIGNILKETAQPDNEPVEHSEENIIPFPKLRTKQRS